jgi:hypothetical protein
MLPKSAHAQLISIARILVKISSPGRVRCFTPIRFCAELGRDMAKKKPSPRSLPRILCDFNSAGWSGEDDDECYYAFDETALRACRPRDGTRVFIYEQGRGDLIMGCEATVESYPHPANGERRWRLRPIHETGYLGE